MDFPFYLDKGFTVRWYREKKLNDFYPPGRVQSGGLSKGPFSILYPLSVELVTVVTTHRAGRILFFSLFVSARDESKRKLIQHWEQIALERL